ncbi:glycosyltransferase family 2 protein [Kineococcus endophyticus]|uniref:Glycosyltransferase family 2 protein n=1 Tax=Kineococcus endophyticus TaxID=1181883 RepID=A0ABV3P7M8_9ACTN
MSDEPVFISACYIVKDEEEFLAASLTAVIAFADEVVVYDTGSSDRTVEIAREYGAIVIEGYWDDDFGAARNRALEHCRGEWVLSVDADEVVQGDPRAWRRSLHLASAQSFAVEVVSSAFTDGGAEHRAMVARVLRRSHCRWEGALHEAIVGRWQEAPHVLNEAIHLRHYGYTAMHLNERNKGERNLRLAESALEKARARGARNIDELIVNVGRSAALAGNHAKALSTFAELDLDTIPASYGIMSGQTVVLSALNQLQLDVARDWIDRMAAWGESPHACNALRAHVSMAAGDWAEAERLIRSLEDDRMFSQAQFRARAHTDELITSIARQGRGREAAEMLLEHVATGISNISPVSALLLSSEAHNGVRRLAEALPANLLKPYLAQLQTCRADATDVFFEHLWSTERSRTAVLVAVSKQWPTLSFEKALEWSLRCREAGVVELCPLRRIALARGERDTITRILCASVLVEVGEEDVRPALDSMLAVVPQHERIPLTAQLSRYAPNVASVLAPV